MITSDFKKNPFWIGKGVKVGTVDDAMLRGECDNMETTPANDGTSRKLLGLVVRCGRGVATRLAWLGVPAKQIHTPAVKRWWWLAAASRHRCYIHGRLPVCVRLAGMKKET